MILFINIFPLSCYIYKTLKEKTFSCDWLLKSGLEIGRYPQLSYALVKQAVLSKDLYQRQLTYELESGYGKILAKIHQNSDMKNESDDAYFILTNKIKCGMYSCPHIDVMLHPKFHTSIIFCRQVWACFEPRNWAIMVSMVLLLI